MRLVDKKIITCKEQKIAAIYFSATEYKKMSDHCLRKLSGIYVPGETVEKQAYGLVGAEIIGSSAFVEMVVPLYKNDRVGGVTREQMNDVVGKYAIPAETPLEERAWAADSIETKMALNVFKQNKLALIGAYHMHHTNSWRGNESRELPTDLDEMLGKDTEMLMFIVACVGQNIPSVKAFYEGCVTQEIRVAIK
jgi:hypothetical protein